MSDYSSQDYENEVRATLRGNNQEAELFDKELKLYLSQVTSVMNNIEQLEILRQRVNILIEKLYDETVKWEKKQTDTNLELVANTEFEGKYFNQLHQILIKNTIKAINSSREYRAPFFAERLMIAVMNPDILVITPEYAGNPHVERPITVLISMDQVAGTLHEYFAAIIEAKLFIGKNPGALNNIGVLTRNDPAVGAKVFEEKYWGVDEENNRIFRYRRHRKRKFIQVDFGQTGKKGKKRTASEKRLLADIASERNSTEAGGEDITEAYRGKYHNTLLARAKFFAHPAPFWELLDKGSMGHGMGDIIPQVATNFVGTSQTQIQTRANIIYKNIIKNIETRWSKEYDTLNKQISRAQKLEQEILTFIARTQTETVKILIEFRGNPAALANKQKEITSLFEGRFKQMGVPESEIGANIESATTQLRTGKILGSGRIAYKTPGGEYKRFRTIELARRLLGK